MISKLWRCDLFENEDDEDEDDGVQDGNDEQHDLDFALDQYLDLFSLSFLQVIVVRHRMVDDADGHHESEHDPKKG